MKKLDIPDRYLEKYQEDDSKSYATINEGSYIFYKLEFDSEKMKQIKRRLDEEYSCCYTDTRTCIRIDGNRLDGRVFGHRLIEIVDYQTTNVSSNDKTLMPTFGGPIYADVVADLKKHPQIKVIIEKLISEKKIDLNSLYQYVCNIKGVSNKINSNKGNCKQGIITFPSDFNEDVLLNQSALTDKEKKITDAELKSIIDEIFSCFTVTSVEKKESANDEITISTSITLEEFKDLKENLKLAKKNSEIVNSDLMKKLMNGNDLTKQMIYTKQ
jgi:hypothetical protein